MDISTATTSTIQAWAGIDVSKSKLDVQIDDADGRSHTGQFENGPQGFARLLKWAVRCAPCRTHFVVEATGRYGDAVLACLIAAGQTASLVNPLRTKHHAIACGQGNKTDKADAKSLAAFCRQYSPRPHKDRPSERKELAELRRHLTTLEADLVANGNRSKQPGLEPRVARSLERVASTLRKEIVRLGKEIEAHVQSHPSLKEDRDLIDSIPGFGVVAATQVLAELPEIEDLVSAASLGAYAGLNPVRNESGSGAKPTHVSGKGRGQLRKALYYPAIVAMTRCKTFKDFAARLENGRRTKAAIRTAVMRKLLLVVYGVLKHRRPFQADYGLRQDICAA
jgi:transposase